MKNGTRKAISALVLCALALTAAACTESKAPAASDTTAASETSSLPEATSVSETTAPADSTDVSVQDTEVTDDSGSEDAGEKVYPFKEGVWKASDENYEGEYYNESYYCFKGEGSGTVLSQSRGIGLGFLYEMDPDDPKSGVFHMGSADSNAPFRIIEAGTDSVKIEWTYYDTTELLTYMCPADDFSYYTSEDIGNMALKLYGMSLDAPDNLAYDVSLENGKVSVLIFDPEEPDGMKSMLKWYFIDPFTGKGTDKEGNEVGLTVLEGGWEDMPYKTRFAAGPDLEQRHELIDEDAMFGFWYVGYIYPWADSLDENRDTYNEIFRVSGLMDDLRFVKTFPSDRFISVEEGQELYLILPADEKSSIVVTQLELDEDAAVLKPVKELYRSENFGFPLLIKCNRSEIFQDVRITMTDSTGRTVEWSPYVSGRDGTVPTDNAAGVKIRDFTDYGKLMAPDTVIAVG